MSNQWLNNLRRKMEDHTEDVPDEWWDDIRDELFCEDDKKGIVFTSDINGAEKKVEKIPGKRVSVWPRIAGIAAAVAFLLIIGKKLFDMANEGHIQETIYSKHNTTENRHSGGQILSVPEKNEGINYRSENQSDKSIVFNDEPTTKNIFENILDKIIGKKRRDEDSKLVDQKNNNTAETIKQNIETTQEQNTIAIENQAAVEEMQEEQSIDEKRPEKSEINDQSKIAKRQSKKLWMLNLLTGSTSPNSTQQFPGYATMDGSPMSVDEVFTISNHHENPLTQVLLANQDEEVKAKVRHKVPVTLGVSLYYNVGKKWGVGTGVNYTKLSSELRSGSDSNLIQSDQSVHYVGIPVQVNYNAVQKGKFTGYVTGGALVEKAVAGNVKTKYIVNNEVKEEKTEKLENKPTQFSVNGGLGFQYRIINNVGVYAEPGVSYHFKDKSSLNTIYKEKPFNFNMKFGIRILIDN